MSTCACARIIWDADDAAMFSHLCQRALGRGCICIEESICPLKPLAEERILRMLRSRKSRPGLPGRMGMLEQIADILVADEVDGQAV